MLKPQLKVSLWPQARPQLHPDGFDFRKGKGRLEKKQCGDLTLTGACKPLKKKKIKSTYVRNPTQQCVLDEKQKGEGRKWWPVG